MKQFTKNIILFSLPFLIAIVVLFLVPVSKKFSYNFVKGECDNKASWIYQRIFENGKNIDIAFTGASQTSCAIMDEIFEKELNIQTVKNKGIANLGYCQRGRDVQYVMLKELFMHKKPLILVIEVAEDEPKKSHPVFPYLAESGDLWGSFVFFNQRFFLNIWKGIIVRFEYIKFNVFPTELDFVNGNSDFGYLPSNQVATIEIFEQNKENWQKRISRLKPEIIQNLELNYSKHYIKKIVQLAQNNHCKVLFLYLPESGSGIKKPLLSDFYREFGELITLPDSIITNPLNWKDATHFNDLGAKKASEYLVKEIGND